MCMSAIDDILAYGGHHFWVLLFVCAGERARACVRACVRVCVRACVSLCVLLPVTKLEQFPRFYY